MATFKLFFGSASDTTAELITAADAQDLVAAAVAFNVAVADRTRVIFLTSGSSWIVPGDFTASNKFEIIGRGVPGQSSSKSGNGAAGSGANYAQNVNRSYTPGATVAFHLGVLDTDPSWFDGTSSADAQLMAGTGAQFRGDVTHVGGGGQAAGAGSPTASAGGSAGGPHGDGANGVAGVPGASNNGFPNEWTQTSDGALATPGAGGSTGTSVNGENYGGGGAGGTTTGGAVGLGGAPIIVITYTTANVASAADTVGGSIVALAAITEAVTAVDIVVGTREASDSEGEALVALATTDVSLTANASLIEAGAAADIVGVQHTIAAALTAAAPAIDVTSAFLGLEELVEEAATAADVTDGGIAYEIDQIDGAHAASTEDATRIGQVAIVEAANAQSATDATFEMGEFLASPTMYAAASELEKSIADVDAMRQTRIDAEAVIDVWDPYRIAFRNLPYLGWGMGVNYWVDGWRETTKRDWVARQWEFKSLRGTLAGIKMAVDFAGRDVTAEGYEVLQATLPPQKWFMGASLTREDREAWLAGLPQLRVWRSPEAGFASAHKSFYGATSQAPVRLHDHRFCLRGAFSTPSTALSRLTRRARWLIHGQETDIRVDSIGSYWQLHLPGSAGFRVFANRPLRPDRFLIPSDAWKRLVTIAPTPQQPWRSALGPTLEPVTSSPERVVESGTRGFSMFLDVPLSPKTYLAPTTAPTRIFERFAVVDPASPGPRRRPAVQFMGVGRLGFPKYTAWIRVALKGRRSRYTAGDGIQLPHGRFWLPHDPKPVQRAREAISASLRLSDKVLLEIGPNPPLVGRGKPILVGIDKLIVGRPSPETINV